MYDGVVTGGGRGASVVYGGGAGRWNGGLVGAGRWYGGRVAGAGRLVYGALVGTAGR